jgi:hypothetical protein
MYHVASTGKMINDYLERIQVSSVIVWAIGVPMCHEQEGVGKKAIIRYCPGISMEHLKNMKRNVAACIPKHEPST